MHVADIICEQEEPPTGHLLIPILPSTFKGKLSVFCVCFWGTKIPLSNTYSCAFNFVIFLFSLWAPTRDNYADLDKIRMRQHQQIKLFLFCGVLLRATPTAY